MDMHSQSNNNSDNNNHSGSQQSPPAASASTSPSPTSSSTAASVAAASRWYNSEGGSRMESGSVPDEMDVFFHSMNEAAGNHHHPSVNSYYTSSAAAVAARAAVHGYHRPSPHSKWFSLSLSLIFSLFNFSLWLTLTDYLSTAHSLITQSLSDVAINYTCHDIFFDEEDFDRSLVSSPCLNLCRFLFILYFLRVLDTHLILEWVQSMCVDDCLLLMPRSLHTENVRYFNWGGESETRWKK